MSPEKETKYGRDYEAPSGREYGTLHGKPGDIFEKIHFQREDHPVSITSTNGSFNTLHTSPEQDPITDPLAREIEKLPYIHETSRKECEKITIIAGVALAVSAIRPVLSLIDHEADSVLQAITDVIDTYPVDSLGTAAFTSFSLISGTVTYLEHAKLRKFRSSLERILEKFSDQTPDTKKAS